MSDWLWDGSKMAISLGVSERPGDIPDVHGERPGGWCGQEHHEFKSSRRYSVFQEGLT